MDHTWGHMGVTSNDTGEAFNGGLHAGLNGTNALQMFSHNGPTDGTVQNEGLASVAYTVEISALQQAGDYTSTITYICTPTYQELFSTEKNFPDKIGGVFY